MKAGARLVQPTGSRGCTARARVVQPRDPLYRTLDGKSVLRNFDLRSSIQGPGFYNPGLGLYNPATRQSAFPLLGSFHVRSEAAQNKQLLTNTRQSAFPLLGIFPFRSEAV